MFLIEWMFDKMGYQKKVQWADVFAEWDKCLDKPKKKPAAKKKDGCKKNR